MVIWAEQGSGISSCCCCCYMLLVSIVSNEIYLTFPDWRCAVYLGVILESLLELIPGSLLGGFGSGSYLLDDGFGKLHILFQSLHSLKFGDFIRDL